MNVDAIVAGDLENSGMADKDIALLQLCENVTLHAYKTTPEDIENLRGLGWHDEQISEAVLVTGMFAMFNRVADAFGLENPGYHEMIEQGKPAIRPADQFQSE